MVVILGVCAEGGGVHDKLTLQKTTKYFLSSPKKFCLPVAISVLKTNNQVRSGILDVDTIH